MHSKFKNEDHRLDKYYLEYRTLIMRNARMFLNDKSAAEDIAHEAFIRLGVNMDSIPPKKVKAWLLCVSERIALDHNKKGGKYKTSPGLNLDEYESRLQERADEFYDLSLMAEANEEVELRKLLLYRLKKEKPNWYRALIMSEFENMDNKTIGRVLGVSPYLVSKWKERGRVWLWKEYRKEYGDS